MLIVLGRSRRLSIFSFRRYFMSVSYQLIRSSRKTVSLEVRPDGTVLVRAPRRMTERAVRDFVQSRDAWLRE